jgi:hypothetical protein
LLGHHPVPYVIRHLEIRVPTECAIDPKESMAAFVESSVGGVFPRRT